MKLGYLIIYVSDVEATLTFYQQAFNLKKTFLHESKQYAEIDMGSTKLAFTSETLAELNGIHFSENRPDKAPAGIEIAFVAKNVTQAFDLAIQAKAIPVKDPEEKPWGQTVAYVRDLNGVIIEICSPMSE